MPTSFAVAILCLLVWLPFNARAADDAMRTYIVSVQQVGSAPDERIARFRINVECGEVLSISGIPPDWYFDLDNKTNCETYLEGGAYHGAGMLDEAGLRQLTFRVINRKGVGLDLSLSGQVSVTRDFGETVHLVDLKPSDFRVERAP